MSANIGGWPSEEARLRALNMRRSLRSAAQPSTRSTPRREYLPGYFTELVRQHHFPPLFVSQIEVNEQGRILSVHEAQRGRPSL